MATTYSIQTAATSEPATPDHVVRSTHALLKYTFVVVPIVAGADKFTNFLTRWEDYLNPMVLNIVPLSPATFMRGVGVIEIIAGVLVLARPRLGAFVVMGWLLAIAAQLVLSGHYLDVAVRDIVMALTGALTLARLAPFASIKGEPDRN